MSLSDPYSVKCPSCGNEIIFERWTSVNADINPEEKIKLLNGDFASVVCQKCGTISHLEYDFLYHEVRGKYMISVASDCTEVLKKSDCPDQYKFRSVSDVCHLVEKIRIFDLGLNDVVLEVVKRVIKDLTGETGELIFYEIQDNDLSFVIFDKKKNVSVKTELYDRALDNFLSENLLEPKAFILVDQTYLDGLKGM